jgi:serine/threonine protein kinase
VKLALEIVAQVAAGLAAVHEQNLVHRDIKPSNIMVRLKDDGSTTAKIIDLGLAKSLNEPGDQTVISRFSGSCMGKSGCQHRYHRCLGRCWKVHAGQSLAAKDPHNPGHLDTHPLVREYYGGQLRSQRTEAWKECNRRLYDYYRALAPQLPDSFGEIERFSQQSSAAATPVYVATHCMQFTSREFNEEMPFSLPMSSVQGNRCSR